MKVDYKTTGCLFKLQACTYSVFCGVLSVESLYSYPYIVRLSTGQQDVSVTIKLMHIQCSVVFY